MSIRTQHFLYCDGGGECPIYNEQAYPDSGLGTKSELLAEAKADGWTWGIMGHYCPQCTKRLNETKP